MHVYFTSKIQCFFFYLDSNYCTLLLKICTCNLFCQQLMNREKMRIYLYLFENGCICVGMYIYIYVYSSLGAVHLMIIKRVYMCLDVYIYVCVFTYYIYFEIWKSVVILANIHIHNIHPKRYYIYIY